MKHRRVILHSLIGVFSGLLTASCMLLDESDAPRAPAYLNLHLNLAHSSTVLAKSASADTVFDLDSLIIILSAPGAATETHRYAVTGRADLGNIIVSPKIYPLSALRTWKAKFISIDTTLLPVRRDTVHLDSVSFALRAAETTYVNATVRPAWSILRVRFVSTNPDSLPNSVKFLRIRVNGVVRDSLIIGGKNASLNWIQALTGSTIHAAGDSGRILRSTNDGLTWSEQVVTMQPLVGGHFFDASNGYVISTAGKIFKSEDGGNNWQERQTTPDSINAVFFTSANTGFTIGRNGGIYKAPDNGGWSWHTLVSNTAYELNGVSFPTASVGFVVGENETILKTSNATADGGQPPAQGGIVWAPVAGGWFHQTSNTTNNITAIHFTSTTRGWAVGHGGLSRLTTNGGATWLERSGLDDDINAAWFTGENAAWAVGNSGALRQYQGEYSWQNRHDNLPANALSQHLHDVRFAGPDTGYVVGANGVLLRTLNGSTQDWPYAIWTQQTLPLVLSSAGWTAKTSNTANTFNGMNFVSATVGWAVGAGGTIRKTTDAGESWATQTSGTSTALNAVYAATTTSAYAVGPGTNGGSGANLRRTTDGTAWGALTSGVSTELRGVYVNAAGNRLYAVGASGVIRRSTNGTSWAAITGGTGTLNAVHSNGTRLWIVGDAGVVRKRDDLNSGAVTTVAIAGLTTDLNGVFCFDNNTVYLVGDGGKVVKTTNNGTNWSDVSPAGVTANLVGVRFTTATLGYVSGANGTVLKTTNGGTNWTLLPTGTTQALNGVHPFSTDAAVVAGGAGTILKTTTGGFGTNLTVLRSVYPVTSKLVYVAGAAGTVFKTTNAGETWLAQSTGTTNDLNSVSFRDANSGFAVGNGGKLLQTTDGGANWSTLVSGTAYDLHSVRFVTPDTGYATGKNGIMIKTGNGGASWYVQETPTTVQMNRVFAYSKDLVFAAGNGGVILKAVNEGDNWTGGGVKKSLKGVYFPSPSIGYIVGQDGTILKTTNGGDFWVRQTSGTTGTLYGVHFVSTTTGWATGDNGVILKTTDGGANWAHQYSGASITLRWTQFRDANRGFTIGGTQSLLQTSTGGSTWGSQFVGVPGTELFDELLTYKYLKPNVSHTVLLEAIDRMELPLRGYQATKTVIVGAGQDSILTSPMARCGYGGLIPDCVP